MKMMQEYIQNAHPADQRVKEMQEMLALLKRRPSTKISFDEMNAIIKQKQIAKYRKELEKASMNIADKQNAPDYTSSNSYIAAAANADDPEAEEFKLLMNEDPVEHKMKTTKILNSLFDNDPSSRESIVMIENKSDCNIIMRIEGVGNSIVVDKGNYLFSSMVCGAQYASQKTIEKSLMVSLGNPVIISSTAK